ncbi:MAG: chemotaxis protein CheD [Campylobacterales bacterium]|nr:chemotaxis protein CheD [Campylobacterales bacterium]
MIIKKFIHVGEFYIGVRPTEISTILGSCVSVCIYDKAEMIGGMNHYLVPLWNGNGLQSPKYGNIAIHRLVEGMLNIGCKLNNMEAKIFGGANVIDTIAQENMMVGRKNIIIAKEILNEYKIPIIAQDVGGGQGRRILMVSDSGKILLKYIKESE